MNEARLLDACRRLCVVCVQTKPREGQKKKKSRRIQDTPPESQQRSDRGKLDTAIDEIIPARNSPISAASLDAELVESAT